jgi:hypothetical protein
VAKQTSKAQLLKDIYAERRRLESNLSTLSVEEIIRPGVTGIWSVKDILAHLAAWEQLFIGWYHAGLQGDTSTIPPVGMRQKAIDEINQHIYQQTKARNLEDVLAQFHASYHQMITIIEAIPEEDMFIHDRFSWTGKLTLADYIAGNTCNHYAWARLQIRKWAKSLGK